MAIIFLIIDLTSSNLTRSNPALSDSCPDAASGESEQAEQQRDRNEFTHVAFTSSGVRNSMNPAIPF
jgi:hypothetical protein